jgi:hypothetical protein
MPNPTFGKAGEEVFKKALIQAKDSNYTFRMFIGQHLNEIDPDKVEVPPDADGLVIRNLAKGTEDKWRFRDMESVQVWPTSQQADIIVRSYSVWKSLSLIVVPILVGFALAFPWIRDIGYPTPDWKIFLAGAGVATLVASYAGFLLLASSIGRSRENLQLRAVSSLATTPQLQRLAETTDEQKFFSSLIEINLENIAGYYRLVREQTDKSYNLTRVAAGAGFFVLLVGISMSFLDVAPDTMRLTVASGVLIEFISAVFFYLYNRTVQQLNDYHEKLVDVQNTMLALRVAQGIQKNKTLYNDTMRFLAEALTGQVRPAEVAVQQSQDGHRAVIQAAQE